MKNRAARKREVKEKRLNRTQKKLRGDIKEERKDEVKRRQTREESEGSGEKRKRVRVVDEKWREQQRLGKKEH